MALAKCGILVALIILEQLAHQDFNCVLMVFAELLMFAPVFHSMDVQYLNVLLVNV
jgi:hypothetical protein